MDFWDYYPSNLEGLFERIKYEIESILGKELKCEKLLLHSDGLYCFSNGQRKRLVREKSLKDRVDNEKDFRELLFLYNSTHNLIKTYKELLETLKVDEHTLRMWMFKNLSEVPFATRFISRLREYFPEAQLGYLFKYKVDNKEKNIVRLWSGLPFINEKGELFSFSYSHIGLAQIKNLDKFERSLNIYHNLLYLFAYKNQLKVLVNHFLRSLANAFPFS